MSGEQFLALALAFIGILGGAFGKTLLDRWFDRDRQQSEQTGDRTKRAFADNEQARVWLREQLDDRDEELVKVRESERELLRKVGDLAAQVARQEERTNAQSTRIDDLSQLVAKLGADYAEMKSERDHYRDAKHDIENKLTGESLRRQLVERDNATLIQELERLRGQLDVRVAAKEA